MDFNEVKTFIETNKDNDEIKALAKSLVSYGEEEAKAFLASEKGKALVQPELDRAVAKGIETYKSKTLPTLVQEELLKLNPPKTEAEKKLAELEQKFATSEREKTLAKLESVAMGYATKNDIPIELVPYFISDTEEATIAKAKGLQEILSTYQAKLKQDFAQQHGREPVRKSNADIKTIEMEYQEALKKGDNLTAIRLKREMSSR